MEYLGLIVEFLLLGLGVYLYLFAIGRLNSKDPKAQKKANAFRAKNSGWMRLAGLALTAIMLVNIFLHIKEILAK